jgi:hypothetical protein
MVGVSNESRKIEDRAEKGAGFSMNGPRVSSNRGYKEYR